MATYYDWDEIEDNIDEEYDENGNTIVEYTTEPTLYGNVISQNRGGVTSHYHFDGLRNITELTNDAGTITDARRYSAFGDVTYSTGTTLFSFQFIGLNGYFRDTGRDELSIRRRSYDPRSHRWTSCDPQWPFDGLNTFLYAHNRPLRFIDPSGLVTVTGVHFTVYVITPNLKFKGASQLCVRIDPECTLYCTRPPCTIGLDFGPSDVAVNIAFIVHLRRELDISDPLDEMWGILGHELMHGNAARLRVDAQREKIAQFVDGFLQNWKGICTAPTEDTCKAHFLGLANWSQAIIGDWRNNTGILGGGIKHRPGPDGQRGDPGWIDADPYEAEPNPDAVGAFIRNGGVVKPRGVDPIDPKDPRIFCTPLPLQR